MAQNFTQNLTQGNLTQGNSRDQLINARAHINELQNTLFKTGGSYTCPTTYANTTQDAIMNQVCHTRELAINLNNGTKVAGGKPKRKRKSKRKSKRKMKKKSKRRK
jgi:hypothetical protein